MPARKYPVALLLIFSLTALLPLLAAAQSAMLPEPTGPYRISRVHYSFEDLAREEVFTPDEDDRRELLVTFYYPSVPLDEASEAFYIDGLFQQELANMLEMEPRRLESVYPFAFVPSPVDPSGDSYPVVIFSPALDVPPLFYTSTLEALASHGYIVAAISHPYSTNITVFPDDRVVMGSPQAMEENADVLAVWSDDIRFLINQLVIFNETDPIFAGRLKIEQIGVAGHAFGGAAAADAALHDDRIRAVLNLNGTLYGPAAENGLQDCALMVIGAAPDEQFSALFAAGGISALLTLEGAEQYNFVTDLPYLAELVPDFRDLLGSIDSDRAVAIINAYTVAFFEQELREQQGLLLATAADYPETALELAAP